jgi:predicted pyridoxine 5'-phosphate oxidase superfamily flavin-nucleotide-binding protein
MKEANRRKDTMITDEITRFIEGVSLALVASADVSGNPHLALASGIKALDGHHLMLENWYCQTTLRNLDQNTRVAIAVMAQDSKIGYQFIGNVVHEYDVAILSGYVPEAEQPDALQALTRLVVRVEEILAFCSGLHTDRPLGG